MDLDSILETHNQVLEEMHLDEEAEEMFPDSNLEHFQKMGQGFTDDENINEEVFGEKMKELACLFMELGKIKDKKIDDDKIKDLAAMIKKSTEDAFSQKFNNEEFIKILNLYTTDPRFFKTIDAIAGKGTADFAIKVINYYYG